MKVRIQVLLQVDENAYYLTTTRADNLEVIADLISSALYDIDDSEVTHLEVEYDGRD